MSCLRLCYEENDIADSTVFDRTHDQNSGTVAVNIATGKKISTHTSVSIAYVTKVTFFETKLNCRQIKLMPMNQILYFSITFFVARFDVILFCF